MVNELVITACGHGTTIDKIWATVFSVPDNLQKYKTSNAAAYCNTQNSLKLEGDSWVFARIVSENTPCSLDSFLPVTFEIFLTLDDRAIQKIMKEADTDDLARALTVENTVLQNKIFRNMSQKTAAMLKEDLEFMGTIPKSSIKESQRKILEIYRRLAGTGELFSEDDIYPDDEPDIDDDADAPPPPLLFVKPTEDIDLDDE